MDGIDGMPLPSRAPEPGDGATPTRRPLDATDDAGRRRYRCPVCATSTSVSDAAASRLFNTRVECWAHIVAEH